MLMKNIKKIVIMGVIFMAVVSVCIPISADMVEAEDKNIQVSDLAYKATVEYGELYGISPEFIQALIETESSGNPNAENGGCKGLCQIYEKYHYDRMERLGAWNLYNERENILVAVDYLAELFEEYQEACLVLDIYNGNSNAKRNYEQGIISDYADGILKRAAELERLHGK